MVVTAQGGPKKSGKRPIPVPTPGPGQAVARQTAIGLIFIDIQCRRLFPRPVARDLISGSEAVRVVETVGPGDTGIAPRDCAARMRPLYAHAAVGALPAVRLVKLTDDLSDEAAASIVLKVLTAHYLIHSTVRVEPGMKVLLHTHAL